MCSLPTLQGEPLAGSLLLSVTDTSGSLVGQRGVIINRCPTTYELRDDRSLCTCAPGSTLSGSLCVECAAGKTKSDQGVSTCLACAAGQIPDSDATACVGCGPGTYNKRAGGDTCEPCSAGSYTNMTGSSSCMSCDESRGMTSNKNNTACSVCTEGHYDRSFGLRDAECLPCPKGTRCDKEGITTASLPIKDGFWRTNLESAEILECPRSGCKAGRCEDGFTGVMCATCERQYFYSKLSDACERCTDTSRMLAFALVAIAVVTVAAIMGCYVVANRQRASPSRWAHGLQVFDISKFKVRFLPRSSFSDSHIQ